MNPDASGTYTGASPELTAGCLRELLEYEPNTGIFTWRVRTSKRVKVGDVAGCGDDGKGYSTIGVFARKYQAHRLAWLYVHGHWPAAQIDHINGRRDDNRIANLRDVSNTVNHQNLKRARKDNRSGLLGVKTAGKNFEARIYVHGRCVHLGTFDTPELAHSAYLSAKRVHHAGCTI